MTSSQLAVKLNWKSTAPASQRSGCDSHLGLSFATGQQGSYDHRSYERNLSNCV